MRWCKRKIVLNIDWDRIFCEMKFRTWFWEEIAFLIKCLTYFFWNYNGIKTCSGKLITHPCTQLPVSQESSDLQQNIPSVSSLMWLSNHSLFLYSFPTKRESLHWSTGGYVSYSTIIKNLWSHNQIVWHTPPSPHLSSFESTTLATSIHHAHSFGTFHLHFVLLNVPI